MSMQAEDDASAPEVTLAFYKRLFPFKSIFNWLNHEHAPTRRFTHREFAFTLKNEAYLRYNSFSGVDEFRRELCRLNPTRFEIGAVYNARPRDRKTLRAGALQPLQRELVFDIDMTDYDEIPAAVKVLDNALRDQFGYEQLLWVYSGRRGIHCWVSDKEAMQLTDEQRKAIMGWLEVIKGGKDMLRKVNVRAPGRKFHPSLQASVDILRKEFPAIVLDDQDCFASEEQSNVILELLSDESVRSSLRAIWAKNPSRSSAEKWDDVKTEALKRGAIEDKNHPILLAMEEIILQYTYPRLDAEVSKHRNHLLKAPFCIHPATGRVCVPVDPRYVSQFDPEKVPSVGQLLRELNELNSDAPVPQGDQAAGTGHHSDWERTSLKPYVEMLDKYTQGLMNEVRRVKREQGNNSMEF